MEDVDVIIIGAGPAGSAAAIALRQQRPDLDVVLMDKNEFPRDKVCGDGIGPDAIDELESLNALDAVANAPLAHDVLMRGTNGVEVHTHIERAGVVIPRKIFDARLLKIAKHNGAQFVVEDLQTLEHTRDAVVVNTKWRARHVIAADGANSRTRRLLNIPFAQGRHMYFAVRAYAKAPKNQPLEFRWTEELYPAYGWIFPIDEETVNIGFGCRYDRLRENNQPRKQLVSALHNAVPEIDFVDADVRAHFLPLTTKRPKPSMGRVLFCGDAANLINPLSGEGIYYAIVSGRMAAAAITQSSEPGKLYASMLHQKFASHFRTTARLARLGSSRHMQDAALKRVQNSERARQKLVAVAIGSGAVSTNTFFKIGTRLLRDRIKS